jgi:SAM-dependent methyltransferase
MSLPIRSFSMTQNLQCSATQKSQSERVAACPLCGNDRLRAKFEVRHITDDAAHRFALEMAYFTAPIFECNRCEFLFKGTRPDGEYVREHYSASDEDYLKSLAEEDPEMREDFRVVRHMSQGAFPRGASILDIGCASGFFLESMGPDWRRFGLELSKFSVERASLRAGIAVHQGGLEDHPFSQAQFDVITLFDVAEHLPNPVSVFKEMKHLLKPGGWLVIGTGDAGSLTARLGGNRWTYMCLPEHLSFFNRPSLSAVLRRAGFSRISFKRIHHGIVTKSVVTGWLRAVGKHRAIEAFGEGVTRFGIFRQKSPDFLVPYFFDHMICVAR